MGKIQKMNLDFLQPKDAWDELSLADKAKMMEVAVRNGIANLQEIRKKYNEFAEGGNLYGPGGDISSENLKTPSLNESKRMGVMVGVAPFVRPKGFIGGTPAETRDKYWQTDTEMRILTDSVANQYGINPDLLRSRLDHEGFTDERVADINAEQTREDFKASLGEELFKKRSNPYVATKLASEEFGLDDVADYINNGTVNLINERWGDGLAANEKGRDTNVAVGDTYGDNIGIMAATLKAMRDRAKKDFPWASESDLDRYAQAYYNRGITGGKKWVQNGAKGYKVNKHSDGGNLFGGGGYVYDVLPNLMKEAGLDVRVTSGYREPGKVGKAGSKSWHGRHGAVDIVPQGKTTFEDIENAIYNNPVISNYMLSNGFGLIDESGRSKESRDTMKKTGATGAHFHIGKDSTYAKRYADKMAELARASKIAPAVSTAAYNPYILQQQNTVQLPQYIPSETEYIRTIEVSPEQQRAIQLQERFDQINRFNQLMKLAGIENTATPAFMPETGVTMLDDIWNTGEYAKGGKIYIKPENRGKFTALKKRTGKSASWFKAHGTPAQKKMATFALNARKWKHEDGGIINPYDQPQTFAGRVAQVAGASPGIIRGADVVSSVVQMSPIGQYVGALDAGRDLNRAVHNEEGAWGDFGWDIASMLPFLRQSGLKAEKTLLNTVRDNKGLRRAINAGIGLGKLGDFISDTYGADKTSKAEGGNIYEEGGETTAFTPISKPIIPKVEGDQEAVNWLANWYNNRREQMYNNLKDYDWWQTAKYDTKDFITGNPVGRRAINHDYYNKLNNMARYKTATFDDLYEDNPASYEEQKDNAFGYTVPDTHKIYYDEGLMLEGTKHQNKQEGYSPMGVRIHERTHASGETGDNGLYTGYNVQTDAIEDILRLKKGVDFDWKWDVSPEIYGRMMEFRYNHNMDPKKKYTKEEIQMMLDQESKGFKSELQRYDLDTLTRALNEVAQINTPSWIGMDNINYT